MNNNLNIKIIAISSIICLLIGLEFIFRFDKMLLDNKKSNTVDSSIIKSLNIDYSKIPQIPNIIVMSAGTFDKASITIKEGEVVNFFNNDEAEHNIIGKDFQSPMFGKTGMFSKGDFKKGEYEVYMQDLPQNVLKIIVK